MLTSLGLEKAKAIPHIYMYTNTQNFPSYLKVIVRWKKKVRVRPATWSMKLEACDLSCCLLVIRTDDNKACVEHRVIKVCHESYE